MAFKWNEAKDRHIAIMRNEGYSLAEIGEDLLISPGSVRRRLEHHEKIGFILGDAKDDYEVVNHRDLLEKIEAFLMAHDYPDTLFGSRTIRDTSLVRRLRNGARITSSTAKRITEFIASDNGSKKRLIPSYANNPANPNGSLGLDEMKDHERAAKTGSRNLLRALKNYAMKYHPASDLAALSIV